MSTFPGAFVPVAPPADGLRLAFVAARRRRNRKAGAAGTAGVLAAVALLASTGGGGERTLLQQEPLPPSSGVLTGNGEPSAAPTHTSGPAANAPVDGALGQSSGGLVVAAGANVPADGHEAAPTTDRRMRTQRTAPVSGPMTRGSNILYTGSDLTCPARKQQERQRGLCTDIYASSSSSTGTMSMTAEICNVGTATEVLNYATARELDLSVRRAGLEVWRWSVGRHFANSPHDLTVGAQECINWTTTWAQVDSRGMRVKAGSYDVVADFDADEVAGPDRHPSYSITIS
jgi:hypothetical protein